MYCEKCHVVTEYDVCPDCGRRHLREPKPDDECLVTIIDTMFGEMLADLLREHQIPFRRRSSLGAALATYLGASFERQYFYVPYERYEEACDLANAFFSINGPVDIDELEAFEEPDPDMIESEDEE